MRWPAGNCPARPPTRAAPTPITFASCNRAPAASPASRRCRCRAAEAGLGATALPHGARRGAEHRPSRQLHRGVPPRLRPDPPDHSACAGDHGDFGRGGTDASCVGGTVGGGFRTGRSRRRGAGRAARGARRLRPRVGGMRHVFSVRIGPVGFRVGSTWRQPIDQLETLYAGYPRPDVPDFSVRLFPARRWRQLVRPSVTIGGDFMLPDALPLLMTGISGAGKSTLAALLSARGWRLMGDEFALLDPATGLIHAFPRLVSLKKAAIGVVTQALPEARFVLLLAGTPMGDIRHLVPDAGAVAAMDVAVPPGLLLFPNFGFEAAERA